MPAQIRTELSLFAMSRAPATLCRRSTCLTSAPVSTTATFTPEPRVRFQASGKPVFFRPHCCLKFGSLGVWASLPM